MEIGEIDYYASLRVVQVLRVLRVMQVLLVFHCFSSLNAFYSVYKWSNDISFIHNPYILILVNIEIYFGCFGSFY